MSSNHRLVLIPKPTRLEGRQDRITTFVTRPVEVSRPGDARFEMGRGPIESDGSYGGSFEAVLEESSDGKDWCCTPGGIACHDSRGDVSEVFLRTLRHRWLRARVEFQGRSVTCWAEGEALPQG